MSLLELSHLTHEEQSGGDKAILAGITEWLSHAEFDPKTNVCIDQGLNDKWLLLREMEFVRKAIIENEDTRKKLSLSPDKQDNNVHTLEEPALSTVCSHQPERCQIELEEQDQSKGIIRNREPDDQDRSVTAFSEVIKSRLEVQDGEMSKIDTKEGAIAVPQKEPAIQVVGYSESLEVDDTDMASLFTSLKAFSVKRNSETSPKLRKNKAIRQRRHPTSVPERDAVAPPPDTH
ncbi:MAG: hypothetical protein Q9190_004978 [Brigantiaea leucoxantha]